MTAPRAAGIVLFALAFEAIMEAVRLDDSGYSLASCEALTEG